jgi:hypothetical protein
MKIRKERGIVYETVTTDRGFELRHPAAFAHLTICPDKH